MQRIKLKACPFCGGKVKMITLETIERPIGFYVECDGRECFVHPATDIQPTKQDAADAWNRRAEE